MQVVIEFFVLITNAHDQLLHIPVSVRVAPLNRCAPLDILDQLVSLAIILQDLRLELIENSILQLVGV
jgi:hypothetical protein